MNPDLVRCLVVDKHDSGASMNLLTIPIEQIGSGNVEIEVSWSSLNYKDALAATGHPGVVKAFPHVPGIDAGRRRSQQWRSFDRSWSSRSCNRL